MGFLNRIFGKLAEGATPTLGVLGADMHAHWIPGIDDGAATMDDSLEMLRKLQEMGYQKAIATPHIMRDGFPNTPEIILSGLELVKKAATSAGIQMELEAAAEYYLDEVFLASIEKGLLGFGKNQKYVLFETSYVAKPMSLHNVVFKLQAHGYLPVLAHPERYQYWWTDHALDEIEELRERGVRLQVNIGSFAGRHGKASQTLARQLVKKDMVDFLGTDMHRAKQGDTMMEALRTSKELQNLFAGGKLLNSTL